MGAVDQIDLIILDLNLADNVSGYDIFNQIRGTGLYKDVPIIAVSASDPAASITKTKERGFAGFIAKPIDDVRFPKQVARIIAGESI
ncbi:MAG: response regulator [Chloroflexota bacterium]|nr:response regulator [Chloroflexota bacterium]